MSPVGAVQREHLQPAQPLVGRVLAGRARRARRSPPGACPSSSSASMPHLQRVDALLLEVPDRILGKAPVREIRERRSAPELEGITQRRRPFARRQRPRLAHQPLEPPRIDRLGVDHQPIARGTRLERLRSDPLAQPRHAVLDVRRRRRRRLARPTARRSARRSGTTSFALSSSSATNARCFGPAERHGNTVDPRFQRAEHPHFDRSGRHKGDHGTPTKRAAQGLR